MTEKEKTYKRIGSLVRGMEILEYLSRQPVPVTGKSVAKGLRMSYSGTMCHLATFTDAGWVVQVGESYQIGMKLAAIWARVRSREETRKTEAERNISLLEKGEV